MDTKDLTSIDEAKNCLDNRKSFVFQGGAGSGKTESLKELLQYMFKKNPQAKVVCITHTNIAADEIKSRIGNAYPVSTIHSFLYEIIKGYKKNIKSIIHELFILPHMDKGSIANNISETDYKKAEHERYKQLYSKYVDRLYSLTKETCEKAAGKKEYDKTPDIYNNDLNIKINRLNSIMLCAIDRIEYSKIEYNQTKFNSFTDLSYGHDGLLDIAHLLFSNFPTLKKIISDTYDYIFIDEFQDTRSSVIEDFLSIANDLTFCLFGDSMQSIYQDGIGNVKKYIESGILSLIPKKDNYRCSYEVLDLINTLRLDDIIQKVEFAVGLNGKPESEENRHGSVSFLYALYEQKPSSFSQADHKEAYFIAVDSLINKAIEINGNSRILVLTNKAIAQKEGFPALYKVFDDRYIEVSDRMDNYLRQIQINDLCELCYNYENRFYNSIITSIKRNGYVIRKVEDKTRLKFLFDVLLQGDISINEALDFAFSNNLLKQSEAFKHLKENNARFLDEISSDLKYQEFCRHYENGENTYNRMKNSFVLASEEEFDDYKSKHQKENFLRQLFSKSINFAEALNYYKYLNEDSKYITMHKTKGSSIDSVIVVMEEFFWTSEYDFSLLYSEDTSKHKKKETSQKLIYVACSRARKNLICVRLIASEEEERFSKRFPNVQKVEL